MGEGWGYGRSWTVTPALRVDLPPPSGEVGTFVASISDHFFTIEHAGSGGPNASSPEIFARIL